MEMTTFRLRVRFGPRSIPVPYVVREHDPPKRVVLEGNGDSVHTLDEIGFAAAPRGTRMTYTADISLPGVFGCIERWLKGTLDSVGKNAVRGLQAALSEESPPPGRSLLTDLQDRLILPGLLGFTNVGYHWHKRSWKRLAVSLRGRGRAREVAGDEQRGDKVGADVSARCEYEQTKLRGRRLSGHQRSFCTAMSRPGAGHTPRSSARLPSNTSQLCAP